MKRDEFLVRFEEIVELPAGTLRGPEKLEDLEGWDSLAMLSFMALVDEQFQLKLSPRQFLTCETVDHLLDLAKLPAA